MQAANFSSYSLWSAKFIFWHFYKHHQITGSMVKQSKELCEKNEIGIFLVWVLFLKTVSTWVYTFSLDLDASNQYGPKTTVSQSCFGCVRLVGVIYPLPRISLFKESYYYVMRVKVTHSVHWVRVSPTPIATDYLIEGKGLTKCRID